ncbi:hypothetical protein J1614_003037 [Plenodomus biglobosus]|nr:hypothetical protein J1614_003037 [Plenodomus biglobosus]
MPSTSSDHHFSIPKFFSCFIRKRRTNRNNRMPNEMQEVLEDSRPPLIAAPLPLVLPEHQHTLSTLGWTTITFPSHTQGHESPEDTDFILTPGPHPLQTAYEALYAACQAFFTQSDYEKQRWKHKLGSEEGWSKIPGEKEFITLRTLEYCPEILRPSAERYWNLMGTHLSNTLSRICTTLDLPDDESEGLRQFVGPCGRMQATDAAKTATMLRLFRYEGWEAKEVAEPHADLGLMSVVVGDIPGLEVWNGFTWFECEREIQRAGRKGGTLLTGRQLERLSNGRYPAGGHRVVSYGSPKPLFTASTFPSIDEKRYRFSVVFVLRAHEPVVFNSADFETEIVGKWLEPMQDVTAGKLYEQIRGRHFNINVDVEERKKQRKRIKALNDREQVGI